MKATVSILCKLIENFINTDLTDQRYEEIISIGNSLSDAVIEQEHDQALDHHFLHIPPKRLIDQYILNCLGHIAAMPRDRVRRDMILNAYTYLTYDDNKITNTINYNEESGKTFIEELITASKEEKRILEGENGNRKVFIVQGDRGIGKTYTVNHLATKYSEYLDDQKVFFIRIDLAEQFGGQNPDLVHWFLSTITYIIFRFYYNKPDYTEFDELENIIVQEINTYYSTFGIEHDDIVKRKFDKIEHFKKFVDLTFRRKLKITIDEHSVDEMVGIRLINCLIEKGYSFIFVVDSLDRIDLTSRYQNRFKNVLERIRTLVHPRTMLGGCFVIICRTETYPRIRNIIRPQFYVDEHIKFGEPIVKRITNIPFIDIINQKLDYLSDKLEGFINNEKTAYNLIMKIMNYKNYLITVSNCNDFNEFIDNIVSLYGDNHRAKSQLLALLYYNNLESDRQRYKVLEDMCKGGFKFPPAIYQYTYNKNGPLKADLSSKMFDNVFMPIIFRFPFSKDYPKNKIPPAKTYLLAGLRIIQLLIKHYQSYNGKRVIFLKEFIDNLQKMFNYKRDIIRNFIEELGEYGFISLESDQLSFRIDDSNTKIIINPKINFVFTDQRIAKIWYKSVIEDIAYLNMSAMRIFINKAVIKDKEIPLFRALSLDDQYCSVRLWREWKIANGITMLRILRKANYLEKNYLNQLRNISFSEYAILFTFDEKIKESILMQIKAIIESMIEGERNIFYEFINHYIDNWT